MSTSSRDRIARLGQFIVDQRLRLAAVEADADDPIEVALKDVEWLLRVAQLAGGASAEARIEMRKGHPGSFEEDFPATTALARALFQDEEVSR